MVGLNTLKKVEDSQKALSISPTVQKDLNETKSHDTLVKLIEDSIPRWLFCPECDEPQTYNSAMGTFECMTEHCWEGSQNWSYIRSPAYTMNYNDANGIGAFLQSPPDWWVKQKPTKRRKLATFYNNHHDSIKLWTVWVLTNGVFFLGLMVAIIWALS